MVHRELSLCQHAMCVYVNDVFLRDCVFSCVSANVFFFCEEVR